MLGNRNLLAGGCRPETTGASRLQRRSIKMRNCKISILSTILAVILSVTACTWSGEAAFPDAESKQVPGAQTEESVSEVNGVPETAFSLAEIASYSGEPYTTVHNNVPYFADSDFTAESFEFYSELDAAGRCGTAYACIGLDLMPTEERGEIGNIKPAGWHTVKYNEYIDGNYLYNRCHLIGYQLSGESANEKNLITGTRYLNVQGMLPFENMVADYVQETENHVLYRVTPVFEGENLLASGVLMEAASVEDKGEGILFCVYVYNVQPAIEIDYATGESRLAPDPVPYPTALPEQPSGPEAVTESEAGPVYILNTNTQKFHDPSCDSVQRIKESNLEEYTGDREAVIGMGYDPCKKCNP